MKKLFLLLFTMAVSTMFAQKKDTALNEKVLGVVINGGAYYLNTSNGLIKINSRENDPYEEYYREIYNDSTIINPNTELKFNAYESGINYFNPAVDISQWAEKYNTFGSKLYLYDFMHMDESGNYIFKPGIIGLINKELGK